MVRRSDSVSVGYQGKSIYGVSCGFRVVLLYKAIVDSPQNSIPRALVWGRTNVFAVLSNLRSSNYVYFVFDVGSFLRLSFPFLFIYIFIFYYFTCQVSSPSWAWHWHWNSRLDGSNLWGHKTSPTQIQKYKCVRTGEMALVRGFFSSSCRSCHSKKGLEMYLECLGYRLDRASRSPAITIAIWE